MACLRQTGSMEALSYELHHRNSAALQGNAFTLGGVPFPSICKLNKDRRNQLGWSRSLDSGAASSGEVAVSRRRIQRRALICMTEFAACADAPLHRKWKGCSNLFFVISRFSVLPHHVRRSCLSDARFRLATAATGLPPETT